MQMECKYLFLASFEILAGRLLYLKFQLKSTGKVKKFPAKSAYLLFLKIRYNRYVISVF